MKVTKRRDTLLTPSESSKNNISMREIEKKYIDLKKEMKQEMYNRRVVIQSNKGTMILK